MRVTVLQIGRIAFPPQLENSIFFLSKGNVGNVSQSLPACLPGLWENCILKMNSKGFFTLLLKRREGKMPQQGGTH